MYISECWNIILDFTVHYILISNFNPHRYVCENICWVFSSTIPYGVNLWLLMLQVKSEQKDSGTNRIFFDINYRNLHDVTILRQEQKQEKGKAKNMERISWKLISTSTFYWAEYLLNVTDIYHRKYHHLHALKDWYQYALTYLQKNTFSKSQCYVTIPT